MKKLLMALSLLVMSFLPLSAQAETMATDKVLALAFHADWCSGCKVLGPKMKEIKGSGELDGRGITFVKFDFTDKATTAESKLHAEKLGVGELFNKNAGKTGFLLLLDPKTHEELGKITYKMETDEIKALLKKVSM